MVDGEVFSNANLAQPERVELDGRAQIEQDIRDIVGEGDPALVQKLADYVEVSIAEALLLRQPPTPAARLPEGLIADIQMIEGVDPEEFRPGDSD